MKTKICSKCGRELPATTEYFYKMKAAKDGLYPSCKECKNNAYKHKCDWCGTEFKTQQKEQRFCSRECQYAWQRESEEYKVNIDNSNLKLKNRPELIKEFKNKFESKFPDFEYYSGYTGCDDYFKMKCKECGHIQERNAQCVRPSRDKELKCDKCEEVRLKEKRMEENKDKLLKLLKNRIKNIRNKKVKPEVNALRRIHNNHKYYVKCKRCGRKFFTNAKNIVHCNKCIKEIRIEEKVRREQWEGKIIKCKYCGKDFEIRSSKSKYCSSECRQKARYRKKEIERREQLKENGKVNYNITLEKLIERDNEICQLCGETINKSDYTMTDDGYFIVGDNYPTVDHIKPVSKGGTHTWDNVQLAHHYCNSVKSNSEKEII